MYHYVSLCIIMYHYVFIIMYYYILLCLIMFYYVLLCLIMYYVLFYGTILSNVSAINTQRTMSLIVEWPQRRCPFWTKPKCQNVPKIPNR